MLSGRATGLRETRVDHRRVVSYLAWSFISKLAGCILYSRVSSFIPYQAGVDRVHTLPQIPHHAGLTLTWPLPHSGSGICSNRKSSRPWKRTAFMSLPEDMLCCCVWGLELSRPIASYSFAGNARTMDKTRRFKKYRRSWNEILTLHVYNQ